MSDKVKPDAASSKPANTGSGTPSAVKKGATNTTSNGDADEAFDFLSPAKSKGELGRLGHFRILKVLGRGGMGTVFMAEDTHLHRIVALKVMLQAMAKKPIARERFIREARAAAKIEHDHIVTIYEVNEANGMPYIAMQFLKGMTLDDWLRSGKALNVPQIMRIGKEIAKALAAAHASQLIHRDIKPSNIWLDAANRGRVKLLDFGLARPIREDKEAHLTQLGMILGTPAYMSPEQARGEDVDARCDLFSLGCVIYRLCTGKLPFHGKDAMSMLLAIMTHEPPPVREANAEVPDKLAELVHRLLAKKPADRPASAKDVVQAIQDVERDWIATAKTTTASAVQVAPLGNKDQTIGAKPPEVDPALEESAITEMELQPTPIPAVSQPARKGGWFLAGCFGSLFTIVSLVCCLGTLIATNKGTIEVEPEGDIAKAMLDEEDLTVWDQHNKGSPITAGSQRLPTGDYHVDLRTLRKGIVVEPDKFTLGFFSTVTLRVRYVAPKIEKPPLVLFSKEQAKKIQQDWATYLKSPLSESNTIGAKLTLIPPGEFLMGSSEEQLRPFNKAGKKFLEGAPANFYQHVWNNERPQHRVQITKPFLLGTTEVTADQFKRFADDARYETEAEKGNGGTGVENGREVGPKPEFKWSEPGYKVQPNHPVANVTTADAEAFCRWLSKKEGKIYRLPTEAEWEYACRAGSTTLWFFGDGLPVTNPTDYMWSHLFNFKGSSPKTPMQVGSKQPNEFGLRDMHGNVAELCADWFTAYNKGDRVDPTGPPADPGLGRVVRGGSFLDVHHLARSAYRDGQKGMTSRVNVGFRVVCEVSLPAD